MPCWLPTSLGGASPTPETPDAIEEVGEGGPSGLAEGPERHAMSREGGDPPAAVGSRLSQLGLEKACTAVDEARGRGEG